MRLDYTIIRGSDWDTMLELEDSDGVAIDLSGAAVEFIVANLFSATAVADVSAGEAMITVLPEDTEGAPDQRVAYPYMVRVTDSGGGITFPQRGLFVVLPSVDSP
jgi:hypothetical protein